MTSSAGYDDNSYPDSPIGNSQNLSSPLGKILRVHITQPQATATEGPLYAIPEDGPFATPDPAIQPPPLGIIHAYGFRNPWRCSFDRKDDTLWCGDVGGKSIEEINVVVKGGNYGMLTAQMLLY